MVYRLLTKNTYEAELFRRASVKLGLDKVHTDPYSIQQEKQIIKQAHTHEHYNKQSYTSQTLRTCT